jgi:hypothetical protein
VHVYKLEIRDIAVESLIAMMLANGQLTQAQALDHRIIEAKLARLLGSALAEPEERYLYSL